jgi:hypothetical protein
MGERLIDDAPDGLRTIWQIRLFAAPVVETFQEVVVHTDIDLWILRHCYIDINLLVRYQISEPDECCHTRPALTRATEISHGPG